ncbi:MAG: DUF4920 domain-containing protein [Bryobacteraceae bacterium]
MPAVRTVSIPLACLAASSLICLAGEKKLGQPLRMSKPLAIAEVMAKPEPLVGKTIQVKGKVTEVCQMAGCWMALADPSTQALLRVKVNDGDIVFPKEAVGKMAVAEGKLAKFVLSREQAVARARHEAEEQGRKFDPESVTKGAVVYQMQGVGAVIAE